MLHQLDPERFDIVVVQEPYLDHNHNMCANHHWYMIYLKEHYTVPGKTRAVMLVNRKIPADLWFQVELGSSDIWAIQVRPQK